MFGIRAKSGHSDDRPKILTFSDGFAKSLSHIKSIVFSYPLASPFSDTYSFIIAMLKIRPKICACNALFFAGLRTMTGFRTYPEHTPRRQKRLRYTSGVDLLPGCLAGAFFCLLRCLFCPRIESSVSITAYTGHRSGCTARNPGGDSPEAPPRGARRAHRRPPSIPVSSWYMSV
jgi:hypothetical protein